MILQVYAFAFLLLLAFLFTYGTVRRGFEPLESFNPLVFKTSVIDHSTISPQGILQRLQPRQAVLMPQLRPTMEVVSIR